MHKLNIQDNTKQLNMIIKNCFTWFSFKTNIVIQTNYTTITVSSYSLATLHHHVYIITSTLFFIKIITNQS